MSEVPDQLVSILKEDEEAIPVAGYRGDYWITSDSRVVSLKGREPKVLRQTIDSRGYPRVDLCSDGERTPFRVHTLVASAFLGPRPDRMEVRHLDGDKLNNDLKNLAYGTRQENEADKVRHGTSNRGERCGTAKLTAEDVMEIREKYATGNYFQYELGRQYNVSKAHMHRIVNRKVWTHLPKTTGDNDE